MALSVLASLLLIGLLLLVGAVVAAVIRSVRHESAEGRQKTSSGGAALLVAAFSFLLLVGAAFAFLLVGYTSLHEVQVHSPPLPPMPVPPAMPVPPVGERPDPPETVERLAPVDSVDPIEKTGPGQANLPSERPTFREEIIDVIGRAPDAIAERSELPEWAADPIPPTRAGNTVRIVLVSERFATVEEAQAQLEKQLHQELIADMREEFPVLLRQDPQWSPTVRELYRAGVFRRKCVATYPLEVGSFTEPVYQLFWDVELNPITRQRLYASWRPAVVSTRLTLLAGALAALTAAMGLGAVALRRG